MKKLNKYRVYPFTQLMADAEIMASDIRTAKDVFMENIAEIRKTYNSAEFPFVLPWINRSELVAQLVQYGELFSDTEYRDAEADFVEGGWESHKAEMDRYFPVRKNFFSVSLEVVTTKNIVLDVSADNEEDALNYVGENGLSLIERFKNDSHLATENEVFTDCQSAVNGELLSESKYNAHKVISDISI